MLGSQERRQLEFFVCGSLRDLVPDDHILARVDRVLELGWLREEVAEAYAADMGRPGIDPEAALRLMLAGFLLGIVHDRRLMREAQVNLAIRWFAGYGLRTTRRSRAFASAGGRNGSGASFSAPSGPASAPGSPRARSSMLTLR